MSDQSFPARLARLRMEVRYATRRSLAYVAALVPVALALAAGAIGPRAAFVVGSGALAGAAFWRLAATHALARRREILDDLILNRWINVAPDDIAQRERELLAPRNRKLLARALENRVVELPVMATLSQAGGITAELRRNGAAIHRLAGRLRSREAIDPRGVVAVEKLIRDGGSPLHAGPTDQIAPALARAERLLDRAA